MNTIVIKDLNEGASDVRELTAKEMESINGGAGPDIGGWSALHEIVNSVTKPIDVAGAIKNGHW
jgi:lactobin A/cerein 7B family class IIb bacteriocin